MGEPAAPTIRRRLRAPPIQGRGEPRAFRIRLREDGVTKGFLVAAYSRQQAAALLQVGEIHLKLNYDKTTPAEREHARVTPGQVWVLEPGAQNFTKWRHQPGATWS